VGLPNDMRRYESVAEIKAAIINSIEDHTYAPHHEH